MCGREEVAGFSRPSEFTHAQPEGVAPPCRVARFGGGRRNIEERRTAAHCRLIRTGQVALQTRLPNDAYCTVQTRGAGDVLGWSSLPPPYRWRFAGPAVEPITAIEVDAAALRERADRDSALAYATSTRLVEILAERLPGARARRIDMYGGPRAE